MDEGTVEMPKPIGDFIIKNATGVMGNDGMYYHYAEVCKLLRLYKEQEVNNTEEKESDARPEWLSERIKLNVIILWDKENINNSNPRIEAVKLIMSTAEESGYTIGIKKATEIIYQYCLTK